MWDSGFLLRLHIFNKLHKTRKQAIDGYLEIVEAALDMGITPRCHFEDVTRADFYGCVVPFATELKKLMAYKNDPAVLEKLKKSSWRTKAPGRLCEAAKRSGDRSQFHL